MTYKHFIAAYAFLLSSLLVTASCSRGPARPDGMPAPQPTVIHITQGGAPLEKASVTLIPVDPVLSRWVAGGDTDSGGKVTIYTLSKYQGVVPGRYKVVIAKRETTAHAPAFVDPNEDPDGYAKMMAAAAKNKAPGTFNLVDPRYGSDSTTPEEIEIVAGKNEKTIDVGPAVRKKVE